MLLNCSPKCLLLACSGSCTAWMGIACMLGMRGDVDLNSTHLRIPKEAEYTHCLQLWLLVCRCLVTDLKSLNGTFINRFRVPAYVDQEAFPGKPSKADGLMLQNLEGP